VRISRASPQVKTWGLLRIKTGTRHCPGAFQSYGYLKRGSNHRYANPEWMKDNVGWVIGAIAIALIIGSIYYVSADHSRTASIPRRRHHGSEHPAAPMSPTLPVRFFTRDCKSYTSPLNLAPLRRDFFLTP
jgi:hypothetical protein